MSQDCLFCKIIRADLPSEKVYDNGEVMAFKDISPNAKEHLLFISYQHNRDIKEMVNEDVNQVAKIFSAINEYATTNQSLFPNGFRVVTNCGPDAGQMVFHTHFHVLGGEKLGSFGRRQ